MNSDNTAAAIASAMATLWTGELPATLRVISAVRDDRRDYRPHPKSRSAWELVVHLATADLWFLENIERGSFQFDPEVSKKAESQFGSISEVVTFYERALPSTLARLQAMPADRLAETVDFFGMMNMTRASWLGFAMNHSVHHRGQLSAYLRSMESKVPDIYGPSADAEAQ